MFFAGAGQAASPDEMIGLQSVIQIRVSTATGLRQNEVFRVDGLGFINHPLAGKVRIVELTPSQAESILERLLINNGIADPIVRVSILEGAVAALPPPPATYRIDGSVKKAGIYGIPGPVTLRQAVEAAGGLKSKNDDRLVRIKRTGKTMKTVRLSSRGDYKLKAGDEIVVLE